MSSHQDTVDYLINRTHDTKSLFDGASPYSSSSSSLLLSSSNISAPHHTSTDSGDCSKISPTYLDIEQICYLYIMCPIALVGVIVNLVSIKVFSDKSFNSVTFKYIRLITWTDLFICICIIPYCLTAYTIPFNRYDYYARNIYLAYVYIPGANIAINLSMFLNLLVTIERLVSVGMPTKKHKYFKPSRYRLSCIIVFALAVGFNLANFFLYKVDFCKGVDTNKFTAEKWWSFFGYIREALTRIIPIILLVISNIILICIVKTSRRRMKSKSSALVKTPSMNSQHRKRSENSKIGKQTEKNGSNEQVTLIDTKVTSEANLDEPKSTVVSVSANTRSPSMPNTTALNKSPYPLNSAQLAQNLSAKRSRQDQQLTWMTIVVAIMYTVTTVGHMESRTR